MATKYIVNNLSDQVIEGGISALTISADTIVISGSPIPQPSYKVYTALLTQTGTSAPTTIVLENTLGYDITWGYSNIGVYTAIGLPNTFEDGKFAFIQGAGNSSSLVSLWAYNNSIDFSQMILECYDLGNVAISFQTKNDILINQFIEIRVYN
jgi:hypothetical protein